MVHFQVVDDQKHLLPGVLAQPPQKAMNRSAFKAPSCSMKRINPRFEACSALPRLASPPSDLAGLLGREQPLAAPRRHSPTVEHAILALGARALQPDVHRLLLHADHLGRLRLAQPRCSISTNATRPIQRKSRASIPEA